MRNTFKSLIGLFVFMVVVLLPSCAKKTTGPGSSADIFEQVAQCDWYVYYEPDTSGGYSWMNAIYRSLTPLTTIPTVYTSINGINCDFSYFDEDFESGKYCYYFDFTYSTILTPGQLYEFALSVDGSTTKTTLEVVYPLSIIDIPTTFNYSQATTVTWTLGKDANYQGIGTYWSPGVNRESTILIPASARYYVIPANTVPADWEFIVFAVYCSNIKIVGKIAISSESYDEHRYGSSDYTFKSTDSMSSNRPRPFIEKRSRSEHKQKTYVGEQQNEK